MLDADAVINSSSQKVGGSNAYPDPAPKNWVGPDPEKTHRIYAPGRRRVVRLVIRLLAPPRATDSLHRTQLPSTSRRESLTVLHTLSAACIVQSSRTVPLGPVLAKVDFWGFRFYFFLNFCILKSALRCSLPTNRRLRCRQYVRNSAAALTTRTSIT